MDVVRRHRRLLAVAGIAVAALLAVVVGAKALESDDPVADPCEPPRAAPPAELKLLPAKLSFDGIGTVTHVRKDVRHVIAQAVTDKPLDEATVLIQDAVVAAGYRPAGMDNEGFEAEVFFQVGVFAGGQALLRRSACAGRWNVYLVLLDPDAPAPRTTTTSR